MRPRFARALLLACVALSLSMTGCRKLWPFGKKDAIAPDYQPATAEFDDYGAEPELFSDLSSSGTDDGLEWISTDDAVPPMTTGVIEPITDQRWSDVVVYFAFDSYNVGVAERPKLETLADYLQQNATYAVVVEGHCDERGSDEYNRSLGERRALAVRDYLVELGVGSDRIETISYGEEKPAVPGATTETQHARNRRAEFVIGVRR